MELKLRIADRTDIFPIMALYQKLGSTHGEDPLFLDFDRMLMAMNPEKNLWLVCGIGLDLEFVCHLQLDRNEGISRLSRMVVDPERENQIASIRGGVASTIDYMREYEPRIDLIYSTTLTLAPEFQHVSLEEGFKIMGIFPSARGIDRSRLNGLTVHYLRDSLQEKRVRGIEIHPAILPFYRIAQTQLKLQDVAVGAKNATSDDYELLSELELITAPSLVKRKFEGLRGQQSLAAHFYPFYLPDTLICDPDMNCEVYVKIFKETRFAAIIGEHLKRAVNPTELYKKSLDLLRGTGVTYIEVINDAGDVNGTDSILQSGFTPTGYIPAFKKLGEKRRDYVVFGRSFEYVCRPNFNIPQHYIDFFKQYYRLEKRNYLSF